MRKNESVFCGHTRVFDGFYVYIRFSIECFRYKEIRVPVNLFAVDISDSMFHEELSFVSYNLFRMNT